MATPPDAGQIWRFGVYEVDLRRVELRRSGAVVKLREQSFRILVYLLEHPGEIVTREELRRILWPANTYVDFDHSLNTAVMKLREALGDSTGAPMYIETIPKRGYRFVAPVSAKATIEDVTSSENLPGSPGSDKPGSIDFRNLPGASESGRFPPAKIDELFWMHALNLEQQPDAPTLAAPVETPISDSGKGRRFAAVTLIAAFVFVSLMGGLLYQHSRASRAAMNEAGPELSGFRIIPVTTASGNAIFPVFSPDGREIAYIWDGENRRRYDVYAQLPSASKPLRLTYSKSGEIGPPAWSPDGSQIAFSRCDGVTDGVYVVPALGGDERKLTTVGCLFTLPDALAWVESGNGMLMIDRCLLGGPFEVVHFSLSTGEKKCLTDSRSLGGTSSGYDLSLSPNGEAIAFTRVGRVCCNIYTIPTSGGTPHLLAADTKTDCWAIDDLGCGGFMWTPDGQSVVFASSRTMLSSLWQVSASGGSVERETRYPAVGSFTKDGRRMVYSERSNGERPAIWRADLASVGGPVLGSRKLISSQYPEMDAQPSPDGAHLAWMSDRTGTGQIWTRSASGEAELQLTRGDLGSGTPRWAPDGKWITFDGGTTSGAVQIFAIDSEGRNLHPISTGPSNNEVPSWSRDGKTVYFASDRTGNWQVWKHSIETGVDVQITQGGGFAAFESMDGQTIYFSRFDRGGIWSVPTKGGSELVVVAARPQLGFWGHWAICKSGIYFLDFEAEPRPGIEFYDFATRRISHILTFEKQPVRLQASLSTTADGKTLYFTQYDRQSVIKMMEFAP